MKQNLKNILVKDDGTAQMISDCLEIVRSADGIIIFGAGVGGEELYKLLEKNGLSDKICAWADNNELKINTWYMREDLLVLPPHKIIGYDKCKIIIASSAYDVILLQLQEMGIDKSRIFLFNFAFMDNEYTDCTYIWDHIEDFQRAYDKMEDEKSENLFINILNYKITKNIMYLEEMKKYVDDEKYQYFPADLIGFDSGECFLDIGAYAGDTFKLFDEVYNGKWEYYYGIEANPDIYAILQQTIKESGYDNKSTLICKAAWNETTRLNFGNVAGSSKVGENKVSVSADRIDNFIKDDKVTFVKMDVEGAEYNVLLGMKSLIQKNCPILAICVYHKRDDYFKLTDLIEEFMPGKYVYYMRQYRYTPTETVCYCIPKGDRYSS